MRAKLTERIAKLKELNTSLWCLISPLWVNRLITDHIAALTAIGELGAENEELRKTLSRWCPTCGFERRERGACMCPDDGEL